MKEEVIVPIILIVVTYILSGRLIPKSSVLILILSLFILYPINNNYRQILNTSKLDKQEALSLALALTFNNKTKDVLTDGRLKYFDRLSLFPWAMYSVKIEESWTDYKHLNRYPLLPISWILPRFLFAEKPTSDTGLKLYEKMTGNRFNSITPSTFGWSYLEGGYLPVFISFLLFSMLLSILQINLNYRSVFGVICYAIFLSDVIKVESDIYFRITSFFQTLLLNYLMYLIFIKRKISIKIK